MEPRALVPVWIVQDTRSGNFVGQDLQMHLSLADAGHCFSRQEALDTAVCQLGYEYLIHQHWVMRPGDDDE